MTAALLALLTCAPCQLPEPIWDNQAVTAKFAQTDSRLAAIEARLAQLDARLAVMVAHQTVPVTVVHMNPYRQARGERGTTLLPATMPVAPTPVAPPVAPTPATTKTCPCSPACVCGCNQGQPCRCLQIPAAAPARGTYSTPFFMPAPTFTPTMSAPAMPLPVFVPAPAGSWRSGSLPSAFSTAAGRSAGC